MVSRRISFWGILCSIRLPGWLIARATFSMTGRRNTRVWILNVVYTRRGIALGLQEVDRLLVLTWGRKRTQVRFQFYFNRRIHLFFMIHELMNCRMTEVYSVASFSAHNLCPWRLLTGNLKIKVHIKTTLLSSTFYGCKICSLYLSEEHELRIFKNRVMGGSIESLSVV